MAAKERTYRALFARANGKRVTLDFFANDRALAYDHACHVWRDPGTARRLGDVILLDVKAIPARELRDAGSFVVVQ